jgi:methylated-DNA-[protein]-cysteine S-methyltransferase
MMIHAEIDSPLGRIHLAERDGVLCVVAFADWWDRQRAVLARRWGPIADSRDVASVGALTAYFAGDLGAIDALEVAAEGTPFQRRVWGELRRIPCGSTVSYGHIARAIGSPAAVRAVGAANGKNPIAIVVPCHRVVGASGTLTGYGGGLDRKRWLLEHEGVRLGVEAEQMRMPV